MIRVLFYKFSTFKSLYGQAGSIKFNLPNGHHDVTLQTHWEDNSEYFCQPQTGFLFNEENDKSELLNQQTGKYNVIANIPEYYNYSGNINGNLIHQNTNIDAKLYGNIDIQVSGNFISQKIKSELCNIKAKSLNIKSTLETQFGQLDIDQDIQMKKLLISRNTKINQKQGNFDLLTGYVQKSENQAYPILQKTQFLENILANNHLEINSSAQQLKIGTFQGRLICNISAQSFFIKSLSGIFHIQNAKQLEIGITNQQNQGILKAEIIKLNLFDKLNFNILKNGVSLKEFNDNYYSIYTECNELIVNNINNPFGIV